MSSASGKSKSISVYFDPNEYEDFLKTKRDLGFENSSEFVRRCISSCVLNKTLESSEKVIEKAITNYLADESLRQEKIIVKTIQDCLGDQSGGLKNTRPDDATAMILLKEMFLMGKYQSSSMSLLFKVLFQDEEQSKKIKAALKKATDNSLNELNKLLSN